MQRLRDCWEWTIDAVCLTYHVLLGWLSNDG